MQSKKQFKQQSKKKKINDHPVLDTLVLAVIIFSMSVIPLLVRIIPVEYPMDQYSWYVNQTEFFDVFAMIKSEAIVLAGILSLMLISYYYWRVIGVNQFVKASNIMASSYGVLIILSTVFSISMYTSVHGFLERYENVFVLLSYLGVFLLCSAFTWKEELLRKVIFAFLISNIVLSIIGICQYNGIDLIFNEQMKPLITSGAIKDLNFDLTKSFEYTAIFQTLYHSNYVGLYIALSLPLFMTLFLYEKRKWLKWIYLLASFMIVFNLFGSISRGGIVGVIVGVPLFIILNFKIIFKKKKTFVGLMLIILLAVVGIEWYSNGFMMARFKQIITDTHAASALESIELGENNITIGYNEQLFKIDIINHASDNWILKYYLEDQPVYPSGINSEGHAYFDDEKLKDISLFLYPDNDAMNLVVLIDNVPWIFGYDAMQLKYKNIYGKYTELQVPEIFGFSGMERLGSARGYIWSRSLPVILKRPLLGSGPETFALAFPQNDYVGKYRAYNTTNMLVDKPHNLYIQIAISTGLISLAIFLALVFYNFKNVFSVIKSRRVQFELEKNYHQVLLYGFTASIFSFLIASFFSDSNVHVSILFWVILGLSYSITRVYKEEGAVGK
ncbi:O-antigen ligase [Fusibacter sp. 3D3]|uniref:O-antigen ligase family protein n=1 Tax=Fusibacter sp. 3D3 TaxID=1048380 RepID=UPI000852EF34|nr:O-antigen ligase family protein [Fusibacter sp. 3D3]GAU76816.1 oligosaccharide repeat unit polymerase Wzy [Fusibacter sp. 3D3]